MKKTIRQATRVMTICIVVLALASPLFAQESQADANKKAEAEMKAALGTVPAMMKVLPDHLRASAWGWFKATLSPDAPIPAKYSELISLGVASQIPCDYCIYAHTTMAKMLGATDAEIQGAVASAAGTRHWSTVLNGANVPFEDFKKEWDGILAHIKKQNEAK
ncbi:MAG: carboxymuconolactone decarboxylase family protein [Bacteroidota bacterium]